jgi:4-amino-4-deoxy-L-arabinose transferase-like glycosyltransferase
MTNYAVLVLSAAVLIFLLWLTQRPSLEKRRPVTLALARLLRRAGRWLWALGEAVEIGFFHGRQVRERISLDLDATTASGGPQ